MAEIVFFQKIKPYDILIVVVQQIQKRTVTGSVKTEELAGVMVKDGVDAHQHIAGFEGDVKKTATGTTQAHGCWRKAERNSQQ